MKKRIIMKNFLLLIISCVALFSCKCEKSSQEISRQFPGTDEIIRLSQIASEPFKNTEVQFDNFEILNAKQEGQWLVFETVFSGGCEDHTFLANWDGRMMKSLPAQAVIQIAQVKNSDNCRERVVKKWAIDSRVFFERGEQEVIILLKSGANGEVRVKLSSPE
ncbi:MAG: hypothetical protein ACKO8Q_02110 [Bacteroidota bacterium]